MSEGTPPNETNVRSAIKITDLGAPLPPEEPVVMRAEESASSRRRLVVALSAAVALLGGMALLPEVNAPADAEDQPAVVQKPDVCEAVTRANAAEADTSKSDQPTEWTGSSKYRLIAAWPQGSAFAVSYGFIYPDGSIELCGKPESLVDLGISSEVRQDELGDLPLKMSYAYKMRSSGSPEQELELVGVRLPDDSVVEEFVLPNGEVRPR